MMKLYAIHCSAAFLISCLCQTAQGPSTSVRSLIDKQLNWAELSRVGLKEIGGYSRGERELPKIDQAVLVAEWLTAASKSPVQLEFTKRIKPDDLYSDFLVLKHVYPQNAYVLVAQSKIIRSYPNEVSMTLALEFDEIRPGKTNVVKTGSLMHRALADCLKQLHRLRATGVDFDLFRYQMGEDSAAPGLLLAAKKSKNPAEQCRILISLCGLGNAKIRPEAEALLADVEQKHSKNIWVAHYTKMFREHRKEIKRL